jgi:hypothetical protein
MRPSGSLPRHEVHPAPDAAAQPVPVAPISASALLWRRKIATVDVDVSRDEGEPLRFRVWIQPVSAAMTAQFGSAQTLLIAGVTRAWRANSDQQRIGRAEAELRKLLAEIQERSKALPYLDEGLRPAATETLAGLRAASVEAADKIAGMKEAALEAAVKAVAKARPERIAEQHEAIVCAGVVGWVALDDDGAPRWPRDPEYPNKARVGQHERVQLTNVAGEESPERGRYHVSILPEAALHALSQAIYDHSSGGAGGRRALQRFRHGRPGSGGAAVGDVGALCEPAPARAARLDAVGDDAAVDLQGSSGHSASESGGRCEGVAGADGLSAGSRTGGPAGIARG